MIEMKDATIKFENDIEEKKYWWGICRAPGSNPRPLAHEARTLLPAPDKDQNVFVITSRVNNAWPRDESIKETTKFLCLIMLEQRKHWRVEKRVQHIY